jgi:hypothetical protein
MVRIVGAVLAVFGLILLYPFIILGVAFGLGFLLLAVLISWVIVLGGLSLRFGIDMMTYVMLVVSGVCVTVSVGLIFLTPFSLELKLVLFDVFLLLLISVIWFLRKNKRGSDQSSVTHQPGIKNKIEGCQKIGPRDS